MTYLPPLNGGRINATISGNTAGAGSLVSSGTLTLAGGNNITLSQNGNAITISGGAAGGGSNTLGMSNLGNTSGTTGIISGSALQFAFAGGNNVTLSQSLNASSGTITISAASQTVQTQNRFNLTLTGNTAGVMTQVSSGTLSLAGGNNITLSQNGNAVTISGGAAGGGSNTLGMSNLGNTSGTTGVVSGSAFQFAFAGGNNVTLSQSINASSATITISAASQTVQTQNLHNITLAGNTAGVMTQVSSGTLTLAGGNNITLSQAGNAVTISAPNAVAQSVQTQNMVSVNGSTGNISFNNANNVTFGVNASTITASASFNQTAQTQSNIQGFYDGVASISTGTIFLSDANGVSFGINGQTITGSVNAGAGGGIALANSQTTYTSGTANLTVAGGAMTIASTTGQSFNFSVPQTSSLSVTGGLSISTNGSTISIGAPLEQLSQWMHNSAAMYSSSTVGMVNTSVSLVRMILPQQISFSRVDIPVSVSAANSATANTAAMALSAVGVIYSRNGATLNAIVGQSSTTTYSFASNTGAYSSITGPRMMSFNLATSLTAGEYYFGFQMSSATSSIGTATTNLGWTLAPVFGTSNSAAPWQDMATATNQTVNLYQPLQGMNSVSISNTSQTHQQSQITQSGATAARANLVIILRNN